MDFLTLNEKHNEYQKRHNAWLESLLKGAFALRESINEKLQPPSPWEDKGKQHPYVYLTVIPAPGNKPERLAAAHLQANSDGIFQFAVAITFEPGPNTFPKQVMWQSVGVRSHESSLQYCIWDRDIDAPRGKTWIESDAAADAVIKTFSDYFDFDPAVNFAQQPKFGFA